MRELTGIDVSGVSGGLMFDESFVNCMNNNWWSDTTKGAIGGAVAGALFGGGGAFPGAIGGAIVGSTAAFGYCLVD